MPSLPAYTFVREERLKSETTISLLFKEGASYMAYPLRVTWLVQPVPTAFRVQIAISVPKKNFRKSTDRNRIKRLMREAWRVHKHLFYEQLAVQQLHISMMLLYVAKEELPYAEVASGIRKVLRKFPVPPADNA